MTISAPVQYRCDSPKRREAARAAGTLNFIDWLDVIDQWAKDHKDGPRQQTLIVHLFQPAPSLRAGNVVIDGGSRVPSVPVVWAYPASAVPAGLLKQDWKDYLGALPHQDRIFLVRTGSTGDFSHYRFSLVQAAGTREPPAGFDPKLCSIDFSFKAECPSPFDCLPQDRCPPPAGEEPPIDYLNKDYGSFRRLMLDRLSVIMPEWKERSPADIGITLVELFAYIGDHLSYYQDAVATEAYLGTARRRVSVRRHARLLDYPMHDGSNARAFVAVKWSGSPSVVMPAGTRMLTGAGDVPVMSAAAASVAAGQGARSFETLHPLALDPNQNRIELYTWGDDACCLPKGATRATLADDGGALSRLRAGDVLVFIEEVSPETGLAGDADIAKRQAVRLTKVSRATDPLYPEANQADVLQRQRVVEIEWGDQDALTFPLCLWRVQPDPGSGVLVQHTGGGQGTITPGGNNLRSLRLVVRIDASGDPGAAKFSWSADGGARFYLTSQTVPAGAFTDPSTGVTATFAGNFVAGDTYAFGRVPVGVALGNVVLVDHGLTVTQDIPAPPKQGRFTARLAQGPLTQQGRVRDANGTLLSFLPTASAAAAMRWELRDIRPAISLQDAGGAQWLPERDLMESDEFGKSFVAETEEGGATSLRFGDGVMGERPAGGLEATYRIGNGIDGNVGAGSIRHVVTTAAAPLGDVKSLRNPLPARGGTAPEPLAQVKLYAPQAFSVNERAVTEDDYAAVAERHAEVLKAVATRRWTGSWHTIFLSVERAGGRPVDAAFRAELLRFMDGFRMAGQDVEIEAPVAVPLKITLVGCVEQGRFRSDVLRALRDAFSSRDLPDGRRGFFHPDNFSFGQPVYLSRITAAATQVPGLLWLDFAGGDTEFRKLFDDPETTAQNLAAGQIDVGRLEVVQALSDPSFPERGSIDFELRGGL